MVPQLFPVAHETALLRADGRPQSAFRDELRCIPNGRNALSIASLYRQTAAVIVAAVHWAPWAVVPAFILMGRAHAQFASLMHEAAHRLLFSNKRANDLVGRWGGGFAICLPEVLGTAATGAAERLRRAIAGTPVPTPIGRLPVAASLGLALSLTGERAAGLFQRARDAALQAKRAGGDRVTQAG